MPRPALRKNAVKFSEFRRRRRQNSAEPRQAFKKRYRVRVQGSGDELPRRSKLHEPSRVHDGDSVGNVCREGKVVGDYYL